MPAGFRITCAVALSTVIALPAMARDTPAASTAPPPAAAMHGDAKRPAQASHWQRAELYFGLGRVGGDRVVGRDGTGVDLAQSVGQDLNARP